MNKAIASNKQGDMFFVIEHNGDDYKILRVAYSMAKAKEMLQSMTIRRV